MQNSIDVSNAESYMLGVAGESHYQEHISNIVAYIGDPVNEKEIPAELHLENDNEHDANAVRVEIEGGTVGYLSQANAKRYRRFLEDMDAPENTTGSCYANIRGGGFNEEDLERYLGVFLDVDLSSPGIIFQSPTPAPSNVSTTLVPETKIPTPVGTKAAEASTPEKPWYLVKFGGKWPLLKLIPETEQGCFYWFFIFPIALSLNLIIFPLVLSWYICKWPVEFTLAGIRHFRN